MSTLQARLRKPWAAQQLYPMLLVTAVSGALFGLLGIASISDFSAKERPPLVATAAKSCSDCGVVESVRRVENAGSGVGAVIGGLIGAVFGDSIAQGQGRQAMALAGGIAGAYAGHEIEKRSGEPEVWQTRVRLNDGTLRSFDSPVQPEWRVGARVKVADEQLTSVSKESAP